MSVLKLFKFEQRFSTAILAAQKLYKFKPKPQVRYFNDIPFTDIPEVSTALIKKTLKTFNVSFNDGFTCLTAVCPMCKKNERTNSHDFYINKATGMFMCSSCKQSGQWDLLEAKLTTKNKKGKKQTSNEETINYSESLLESLAQIRDSTKALYNIENLSDLLDKFKLPSISNNAFENIDIRVDDTLTNLYFPLENVQSEIVGYRKIDAKKKDLTLPDVSFGGLLTAKAARNKDTAVLVPGIADFLVLLNAKIAQNIVCLPNTATALSPFLLPSLERFKKLVLWFGNDIILWDSARNFANKLGEKRCLFIRPTDENVLPHLANNEDFKSIINSAQPIWHKSITTFASLRQDVLSDLQNIDKVQGVKWKRFPTLNKIIKGHRRGELTIITGPTGSGKTTFISEYSLDLATQGVNTLWGSFEIRNARLARTMLQQYAGLALDENLQVFDHYADSFEQLPIYFMTFHGQQTIKVVMEAVEHAAYVHDINHIIIDNVQFMMGITDEHKHMDRFWKQDSIIAHFRTFATRKNCHVTLVIHPRKEREDEDLTTSSIFGGAKAAQEADNVLIIQDRRLTSVRGKKYLQVAKNRYSGDLGVMALEFDKASLSYAPVKKKKEARSDDIDEKEDNTLLEDKDNEFKYFPEN